MSLKRSQIRMTTEEREAFLDQSRTLYLASHGADGFPHLVAMWFVREGVRILMTTYRKSPKVANLRADARSAILFEDGTAYNTLRGVFLRGRCTVIDHEETTLRTLEGIRRRSEGGGLAAPDVLAAMRAQARKRVVLSFEAEKTGSWDHAKLGGVY